MTRRPRGEREGPNAPRLGRSVVDVYLLTTDIVETAVYLATPPLLWMVLFLVAWGDRVRADESGFGRRTFWLLLPGALFGMFSNLPIFAWTNDFLAINIGGGLIPLVLSVLLIGRILGDQARLATVFFVAFAVLSYLSLAAVFLLTDGPLLVLVLALVAVVCVGAMTAFTRTRHDLGERLTFRRVTSLLGLTSVALVPTFASTSTVPGLGIVSAFPWYLFPPIAVGFIAVLAARPMFGVSRRAGLGLGYAAATFGVLIGADLLREPPLYGGSAAGLYAIGGAGTGDLLYLSGLLALTAALAALWLIGLDPVDDPAASEDRLDRGSPLTSGSLLRRSLVAAVEGRAAESVRDAHAAVEAAWGEAHALLGAEAGPGTSPGSDPLAAPAWVEADRTNLAALARSDRLHPLDATRAWMTARWIVRFTRSAARRAYASFVDRGIAFLIDLAILTTPAAFLWYYVIARAHGTVVELLTSPSVNVVLFAYTSASLLYFVLAEADRGTTLGKWLMGIRVRPRGPTPPGPKAVLVRNLPKLAPLTLVGGFGILAIILAVRGSTVSVSLAGGLSVSVNAVLPVVGYLAAGLGVIVAISAVVMHYSPDRQRLGDLLADTWVVRASPRTTASVPETPAPAARFG